MTEKARAIVIRGSDWSETSRIITLFSREFGKIRAVAKGGRRLRSNFEIAFDLLTVCDVVVIRKAHAELDLLTEARLVRKFPALNQNLVALYSAYYIAELLTDGTADYDPHPELFDFALESLAGLPENAPQRVMAFELAWLRELGYSPRLAECAVCGQPLPATVSQVQYSPAAGGLVCSECTPAADGFRMDRQTLEALQRLARNDLAVSPEASTQLRTVLNQTVCYLLGRRPRLLSYLDDPKGIGP